MRGARLVPLILDCAAENGHTEIVTALIAAGGNVNAVDNRGNTPMLLAALSGPLRLPSSAAQHRMRADARARTAREHAH